MERLVVIGVAMRSDQKKEKILEILNELRKKVLLIGQPSLSESRFDAFRKLTLDAFGKSGAEEEIEKLFESEGDGH